MFGSKIAVATKVTGLVEIIPTGEKDFLKLKPGRVLSDGDKIRTGSSGFAAIIFIDDKSILKLKENSEAVIAGQRTAASISKKINMDFIKLISSIHLNSGEKYGFNFDTQIGGMQQKNKFENSWVVFFGEKRLNDVLEIINKTNPLPKSISKDIELLIKNNDQNLFKNL